MSTDVADDPDDSSEARRDPLQEPLSSIRDSDQLIAGSRIMSRYLNLDPRFNEGETDELPDDVSGGVDLPGRISSRPFRKDEHDAITRRWLAFVVLGVVSVLYGAAVLGLLMGWIDMDELSRVALVLGPIQALAAAVLGFYFGQDKGR